MPTEWMDEYGSVSRGDRAGVVTETNLGDGDSYLGDKEDATDDPALKGSAPEQIVSELDNAREQIVTDSILGDGDGYLGDTDATDDPALSDSNPQDLTTTTTTPSNTDPDIGLPMPAGGSGGIATIAIVAAVVALGVGLSGDDGGN